MNCNRFARLLADFQDGKLPARERLEAEEHLERCPACRTLLDVAAGRVEILPEEMREGLALSILEHTSGSVCPRVEASLWEFASGEMKPGDSRLLALHLEHCAGCKSRAEDLALLQNALPAMAEIDPGEPFTRNVIRATSGLSTNPHGFRARFFGWWNRMVQRPRFALEAAYACTVLLIFALGPFLPFRNIGLQAASKAIYPSAKYGISVWVDAKTPISNQARKLASSAVSVNRAVTGTLSGLAGRTAHSSSILLDESLRRIGGWNRQGTADLAAFRDRLYGWVPRNKQ